MHGDFGKFLIAECSTPEEARQVFVKFQPDMRRCIGHSIIEVIDGTFIRETEVYNYTNQSEWRNPEPCYLTHLVDWRESDQVHFQMELGTGQNPYQWKEDFKQWHKSQKPFKCLNSRFSPNHIDKSRLWVLERDGYSTWFPKQTATA